MRRRVIHTVHSRVATASSAVYSRSFVVNKGIDFARSHIPERLERLAYHKTNQEPEHPGEYRSDGKNVEIFLRNSALKETAEQGARRVILELNPKGLVSSIRNASSGSAVNSFSLEPEMLALLGNSSTRASTPKTLSEFPEHLKNAVISIEDQRFYRHLGLDPLGLMRAVLVNLTAGGVTQGGSTITQQLAKNLFFTRERSFSRKLNEAVSAILIETAFSKEKILELYLNEIFLGQEGTVAIHGFGEAAKSFFGKEVEQLTLAEASVLAGMIRAPSALSPRLHLEAAKQRQAVVLDKMLELGYIKQDEAELAKKQKLEVRPAERAQRTAPYFVDYIRRTVLDSLNTEVLSTDSLSIVTGLDREYQRCADTAVDSGLAKLEKAFPRLTKGPSKLQSALIAVNPLTGDTLAWVGGRDYGENQFDRVSQSKRQPGSAFKPFVYLTALDKQLNNYRIARTTTLLMDEPTSIPVPGNKTWEPKNYDEKYRGEVTLRQALTHSLNVPTVELALKVGIDSVKRTAELFGFGKDLPAVPSLALGAGEVSPLDLARAYAAIANGGTLLDIHALREAVELKTNRHLEKPSTNETRAASEPATFVLTDMLRSVVDAGTANTIRKAGFNAPAAGKTGTSNDTRDAWFAGFTPRFLAVVWVGFDDNRELKLTGGQAAAPIWAEFAKCISGAEPELDFVAPAGVVFRTVDKNTGLLLTPNCPASASLREVFVEGTEPVTECNAHTPAAVEPALSDSPEPSASAPEASTGSRVTPEPDSFEIPEEELEVLSPSSARQSGNQNP